MKKGILMLGVASVVLSACAISPVGVAPVVLYTEQGPVSCQLYDEDILMWDRAISYPDSMRLETAHQLCRDEGVRRYNARN